MKKFCNLQFCLNICQVTSARRQRSDRFWYSSQFATYDYLSNHTKTVA